jgi:hypothetical protein
MAERPENGTENKVLYDERERSRIYRLERQDEMRVYEQYAK